MGERRLRSERELLVLAAQHPEQRPDLAERLAPGVLHGSERQLGVVGLRAREPLRGRRLGDHRGQRVADQVVELARDPGTLGGHRAGRPGLAVVLGGRGLARQRLVELHACADEPPEQDRAADDDRGHEEEVTSAARRMVEADRDRRRDDEHGEAGMELSALGVRAERVAEDQRREERPDEVRVDRAAQALEDGRGRRRRQRPRSPAPAGARRARRRARGARRARSAGRCGARRRRTSRPASPGPARALGPRPGQPVDEPWHANAIRRREGSWGEFRAVACRRPARRVGFLPGFR